MIDGATRLSLTGNRRENDMSVPLKPRGIVVGTDGSAASNVAVLWAARDAAMRHVPLTLVHVVNPVVATWPQIPLPGGVAVWRENEGRKILDDALKIAEEATTNGRPIEIKREIMFAATVPMLVDLSKEAELMALGSDGRRAVARGLLGSVSSSLVRRASCPVAVIRDEDPLMPHPEQAPVLVGIDGSPASELATAIAFDEASRRGVELRALHTWSDVEVFEYPGLDWPAIGAAAERDLAERLAGWQERYPDVTVRRLIVCDRPAHQLIEQSESAQLVVVGSHGRGGFTGMLLGSVSNAVLHSVRMPVIVARPS